MLRQITNKQIKGGQTNKQDTRPLQYYAVCMTLQFTRITPQILNKSRGALKLIKFFT